MISLMVLFGLFSAYVLGLAIIAGLATLAGNLYDRLIDSDRAHAYRKER